MKQLCSRVWRNLLTKYLSYVISGGALFLLCLAPQDSYAQSQLLEEVKAGVYSANGLYNPEIIRYDNGLTLIVKQRSGIRTVSARVYVSLGMAHYKCGERHVPHFLEHMLYDAISGMSEKELERRFFELGAITNAMTQSTETIYQVDVFSGKAIQALDLTADMLTKGELRRPSFKKTKRIIFREEGGEPGPVEKESLARGKLASGMINAMADVSPRHFGVCGEWDAGQNVAFSSIKKAYARYYIPQRMVWVVVGDFNQKKLMSWANERLSSLKPGSSRPPEEPDPGTFRKHNYSGFADEPSVALMAMTNGLNGDEYYARSFIEHFLDAKLFERLRLDSALTYTPDSAMYSEANWGVFTIMAETEKKHQPDTLKKIKQIIRKLTDSPLSEDDFRVAQLSLLRNWAQSVETNADYAEHYIASLPQFRRDGYFLNEEVRVAALTPETVQRAARNLFLGNNVIYVRDGDRQAQIGYDH